jgi:uncharacterized protein (TIGR00255 family)
MTGFGYHEFQDDVSYALIDLKSYNNRYLDIQVSLPPHMSAIEPRLRDYLSSRINRGRVEVYLKLITEEQIDLLVDKESARSFTAVLQQLISEVGINDQVKLSHLLRMEGILKPRRKIDVDESWQAILPHLETAFAEFERSRINEGDKIEKDILEQLDRIDKGILVIDKNREGLKDSIVNGLRERFEELLGEGVDENRIYSESALMLMKFDVNEEVMRLGAHVKAFRDTLKSSTANGPPEAVPAAGIGKKLDFICQELNREINTIGSKSTQLEIHSTVISVKEAIERIREQLRNVE